MNVSDKSWHPRPKLTAYLYKVVNENQAITLLSVIKKENDIATITYISKEEAIQEFRQWSCFPDSMETLEENPLPAVIIITPKINIKNIKNIKILRDKIAKMAGIEEVKIEENGFSKLILLSNIVIKTSFIVISLIIFVILIIIKNSIYSTIFKNRDKIYLMKLIGATDKFILQPFICRGALLGLIGANLSIISSKMMLNTLFVALKDTSLICHTTCFLYKLSLYEAIFLISISTLIGSGVARLAVAQYLRRVIVN
ncbi:cell division protein [secondary endosymbiont of Heteropsylla cubana]|uniref:Cell division protein n=1 Tax=secondary endosymbiont of Heteropsylla cubana TaxID=134287 RepID=J3Z527_9ENTR|nr:permease-like cell division protein FtsX [secondary endosymbiont of Heteropsylla cubana]AFP85389.1 cell division protein [secondary endosymbiont of Heteropsylla cubana]